MPESLGRMPLPTADELADLKVVARVVWILLASAVRVGTDPSIDFVAEADRAVDEAFDKFPTKQ